MEEEKKPPYTDIFDKTDSIDFVSLFTADVSASGSFDVRGVQATAIGKLLQAIPVPVILVDQSYCIAFANQACGRISTEYEKILGKPVSVIFPYAGSPGGIEALIETVFSTRRAQVTEGVLEIEDSRIWGRVSFRSVRMHDTRAILLLVEDLSLQQRQLVLSKRHQDELRREIAERKKAEEELRKAKEDLEQRVRERTSELLKLTDDLKEEVRQRERAQQLLYDSQQRFELALKGADLGLWDYDVQQNQVFVDRRWADILGYSLEEIEPRVSFWRSLIHPDDRPGITEEWNKHMEGRSSFYEAEHRMKAKSGEWKWVLARGTVVERDQDGKPLRFSGTVFDVTARKRSEERLLQLSKVFMESIDPIFIRDLEGTIVDLNEAAETTYGWSRSELIGQSIKKIVSSDGHDRADELNERCKRGERIGSFEALHCTKAGEAIPVLSSLSLLTDSQGKPVGMTTITKNLSDLKRTEAMLRSRTEELERSNRELEEFASIAAHDLREPLLAISAYVRVLKRRSQDNLDSEALRCISQTLAATERMDALIQSLLSYSRLGSGPLSVKPTDFNEVLGVALTNLKPVIDECAAAVTSETLPTLRADSTMMAQLFQNLLSNAVKFRGDRPLAVRIGALKRDRTWVFYIRDNGIGIEQLHFDKIFRLFQRVDIGSERPGTGIGLANCKKIVEQHGGRIWVESELGKGSTFFFEVPEKEPTKPKLTNPDSTSRL
jgi:PAS domain S-box-containing protein